MNDDPPTTKAAIIARNLSAANAMNAALSHLSYEQLLAPNAVGTWSLRDVLSHIGNHWFPTQMEAHLEGRDPTPFEAWGTNTPPGPDVDMSTQDGRNAWLHEVHKDRPLPQVQERYLRYLERMDRLIEALPESEFEVPYSLTPLGWVNRVRPAQDGEQGFPLWRWIQGEYWHHLEDHLPAFEAAAAQSSA